MNKISMRRMVGISKVLPGAVFGRGRNTAVADPHELRVEVFDLGRQCTLTFQIEDGLVV